MSLVGSPGLLDLSPELIEAILEATLDYSHAVNVRRILRIQLACKALAGPARRIIFRNIVLPLSATGRALLLTLRRDPSLGRLVRSLRVPEHAYREDLSDDLVVDDIIRFCPLLTSLDTAVGPFGPLADGCPTRTEFPPLLRHFRVAMTVHDEWSDDEQETDSDDDSDASTETALSPVLARLVALPASTSSLTFTQFYWEPSFNKAIAPLTSFPLAFLCDVEFSSLADMSPAIFRWILEPSIENHSLRRLKCWYNGRIQAVDVQAVIEAVGSDLEEFLWLPHPNERGLGIASLLPHLSSLKELTIGAGGAGPLMHAALATSSLTHLSVGVPEPADLTFITDELVPGGKLASLRRLEIFSQMRFPQSREHELEFLDESTSPATQLRELRLSRVVAPRPQMDKLFSLVGSGLRALSLHHIKTAPLAALLAPCPRLLWLELGVEQQEAQPQCSKKDVLAGMTAPGLHLLRIHFNSGIKALDLVNTIEQGKMGALRLVDITGSFPESVPEDWTGATIERLIAACVSRNIELCSNGRSVGSTIGGWWDAFLADARETGTR